MAEKKYTWHKLSDNIEALQIPASNLVEIELGEKKICIALHNQTVFACAAKCPHAGGSMAEGCIDAIGNVVCPIHRYKFNLAHGKNTSGEGYYLKTYPVQMRPDGIFVGFEVNNLFNWGK